MNERVTEFAAHLVEGIQSQQSAADIAIRCDVSAGLVRRIARELGVLLPGRKRGPKGGSRHPERDREMALLFTECRVGMDELGRRYGLSRERVRQILFARFELTGKDGGYRKIAADKRAALAAEREARYVAKYGLSEADYRAAGSHATRTFNQFRTNARRIFGTECKLTFGEWWGIWQASGCWSKRTRGKGYAMRRYDRSKPYELGNVYIGIFGRAPAYDPNRELAAAA